MNERLLEAGQFTEPLCIHVYTLSCVYIYILTYCNSLLNVVSMLIRKHKLVDPLPERVRG